MKKTKFIQYSALVIGLLTISNAAISQTISGTVIDKETQVSVAFANITIGENYGVITNDEGKFEIATSRFKPTDSLVFSFLGYNRKAIAIKDFSQETVFLTTSIDALDEVYLVNKNLNPIEILEKVNANLSKNYDSNYQKWTVFQRSKTSNSIKNLGFKLDKADFIEKADLKKINQDLESISEQSKNSTSSIYIDTYFDLYKNTEDEVKISLKKRNKTL